MRVMRLFEVARIHIDQSFGRCILTGLELGPEAVDVCTAVWGGSLEIQFAVVLEPMDSDPDLKGFVFVDAKLYFAIIDRDSKHYDTPWFMAGQRDAALRSWFFRAMGIAGPS